MFIRFVFFLSIAFYSSFTHSNPLAAGYFEKRDQLFSLPLSERYSQLIKTQPFDLSTPEGRYFYNVILLDSNASEMYKPLSDEDIRYLERQAPELALEYELVNMRLSAAGSESRLSIINSVIQRAKESGYQRLARFATSDKVSALLDQQRYKQAIDTMLSVIDSAPDVEGYMTTSDYPLPVIYKDLADAFFMDSQPDTSIYYCQRYASYLAKDEYVQLDAKLCKARALLSLKEYTKVIQEAHPVREKAQPLGFDYLAIAGSLYIAKANVGLGHFDIAMEYAKSALTTMAQKNLYGYGDELYLSIVLAQAYNGLQQPDNAIRTISALRDNGGYIQETPRFKRMLLEVEAEASLLKADHLQAITALKQIIALDESNKAHLEQAMQTPELLEKLNQNHLEYLQGQYASIEKRNRIVLIVSVVAIICAIFLAGVLYRSRSALSQPQTDASLDVYTNTFNKRAFDETLEQVIDAKQLANDAFSIARLDVTDIGSIKQHGRQHWEESLLKISSVIAENLDADDTVCRLDGGEFVILLPKDYLHEATRKLQVVNNQLLSIRFPCNVTVLEFMPNIDKDAVMTIVDDHLAKNQQPIVNSGRVSPGGDVKSVVIAHS